MLTFLDRAVMVLAFAAAVSFAVGFALWFGAQRALRRERPSAVVSDEEAGDTVYPYVFVNDAGSVRELSGEEREYLQTPFPPRDILRPYVKSAYDERNLAGTLRGYCRRRLIPRGVRIAYPPIEVPARARPAPHYTPARPAANGTSNHMLY